MCVTTQLEDGHSLFDYDVGLNDIIQLMVRPVMTSSDATLYPSTASTQNGTEEEEEGEEKMDTVSTCTCLKFFSYIIALRFVSCLVLSSIFQFYSVLALTNQIAQPWSHDM